MTRDSAEAIRTAADSYGIDLDDGAIDEYAAELSGLLSVPVRTRWLRTDGGRPSQPDLLVRRGSDDRLHDALFEERVPNPGCTTVTVYPHESRRPSLGRRLLERVSF